MAFNEYIDVLYAFLFQGLPTNFLPFSHIFGQNITVVSQYMSKLQFVDDDYITML